VEWRKSAAGAIWCCICSMSRAESAGSTATRCRCSMPPANVMGYRGVARDITQQRLQQERIARLSRIQAVLSGINSTIVRVRERRELLSETCRIAVQQADSGWPGSDWWSTGARKAIPLVWDGFEQGYLDDAASMLANREEDPGPVGRALHQKKMMVVERHRSGRGSVPEDEALARGFRSQMAMPLMVEDRAVGVLVLYAAETGFFDYEELKLLKDLAGDISFALDYIDKQEKLTYVSYYDTLTGLANRQLFFDRLAQGLHSAARRTAAVRRHDHRPAALQENHDTLGRYAGDQVLKNWRAGCSARSVSPPLLHAWRRSVRGRGTQPSGNLHGRWIDNWIVDSLPNRSSSTRIELRTTVKVGIALYPADADTAESLFANAEAALKRAKDRGRAVSFLLAGNECTGRPAPAPGKPPAQGVFAKRVRSALSDQGGSDHPPHPGLEALLRWNDPEFGLVPPSDFVPLLEESGLIVEIGLWVIEQAVADARLWRSLGLDVAGACRERIRSSTGQTTSLPRCSERSGGCRPYAGIDWRSPKAWLPRRRGQRAKAPAP